MSALLSYEEILASPPEGPVNQQLWRHEQPRPATSLGQRQKEEFSVSPASQTRGRKVPAEEHTNFSWKTGDLVFWQIQNPHGLKQFDILRNDLNQSIADVLILSDASAPSKNRGTPRQKERKGKEPTGQN